MSGTHEAGDDSVVEYSRQLSLRTGLGAVSASGASLLPVALIGALIVQVRGEIEVSTVQLATVVATFSAVSALTSIFAGRLVDRLGWVRSIWIACGLLAGPLLAVGILSRSANHLIVIFFIAGFGNAIAQPSANVAIFRGVPPGRRGLAFGLKQAAIPASSLAAGLAVPFIGLTIGWRWAFIFAAVSILLLGAAVPRSQLTSMALSGNALRTRSVVTDPALLLMAGANFTSAMGLQPLLAFLVEASVARGIDSATAGLLLATAGAMGVASRIVVGWFSDKLDRTSQGMLVETAIYAGIGFTGMFVIGRFGVSVPTIAFGLLLALGFGFAWSGQSNLVLTQVWRLAPAAAAGVAQTGLWVGGMLGPLLFGVVATNASYDMAFYIGGGFMALTPVCLLLMRHVLAARGDV